MIIFEKPIVHIWYPDGHFIRQEMTHEELELYFPNLKRYAENDGGGDATHIYESGIRATVFLFSDEPK